jgi:hypothetical protein
MQSVYVSDEKLWYIAHNGVDVFHTGESTPDGQIATGQPILETFVDELAFKARCAALGVKDC